MAGKENSGIMRIKLHFALVVLLFCYAGGVGAQNLDHLSERAPVKVTGGVNATGIYYNASGIEGRRDPFTWYTTGNVTVDLYGWRIPLSFSFSNQSRSFSQPFNRYGITPQYKWAKAYLGYNSMTFSRYTLAGHVFLGGGVELTPGKWQVSAMYGRLNKAVAEDTLSTANGTPAYRRMGYGMKIGYQDEKYGLEVALFHAEDELNSIPYVPESAEILPQENLVVSVAGRKQLFNRVNLNVEYATSALTHDTRSESSASGKLLSKTALFTSRMSSQYNHAFNTSVSYAATSYTLSLNYERIDPGFNTLGAYYFNNDLENMTINGSWRTWENKLTLGANVGTQKNNLEDTEVSTTDRVIASFNAMLLPNDHWSMNGTYSNFTTYTNVRPQLDPFFEDELDTLNFYQINQNSSASVGYTFGSRENKQSVFVTGSYQASEDDSGEGETSLSEFMNGNMSYRCMWSAQQMSLTTGVSLYKSKLSTSESTTYGPNASVTGQFMQKALRGTLATSYNIQTYSDAASTKVLTIRAGLNLMPEKLQKHTDGKHSGHTEQSTATEKELPAEMATKDSRKGNSFGQHRLGLNVIYLHKESGMTSGFREVTATLTYSYSF